MLKNFANLHNFKFNHQNGIFPSIQKVVCIITIFVSCKGNEPKGETKENILEDRYSYEIYSKLVKSHKYLDYVNLIPPPPQEYTIDFTEEDFWRQRDSLIVLY